MLCANHGTPPLQKGLEIRGTLQCTPIVYENSSCYRCFHQSWLSGHCGHPHSSPLHQANPTGPPQHVTLSGDHHLTLLRPLTYPSEDQTRHHQPWYVSDCTTSRPPLGPTSHMHQQGLTILAIWLAHIPTLGRTAPLRQTEGTASRAREHPSLLLLNLLFTHHD